MAAFILTPEVCERLREAKRLAVASPISLETVKEIATVAKKDSAGVISGGRPPGVMPPQQVFLPLGWRVAISCEEQPIGLCLHISMSTPTPLDTLAREQAITMVLEAIDSGQIVEGWVEQFNENGMAAGLAVNVLAKLY